MAEHDGSKGGGKRSGDWMNAVKNRAAPAVSDILPLDISEEEADYGFTEALVPNPKGRYAFEPREARAVVRDLTDDLMAVKMQGPDGVSYAIWNRRTHRPVQRAASSVEELRVRFGG